jgi:membrane associated rhomboid family serine protease
MPSAATVLLILIIVVSAIGLSSRQFIAWTVLRPYQIARGSSYATLVTHGFVHADIAHLAFNLITLYSFASPLEQTIGTTQFVILYCSALLVSAIGTCIKHRNEPNYASLGASGAILGVLFASIVYFPHQKILILLLPVPIPAPLFALGYLAYSYYESGRNTNRARQSELPPQPGPLPPDAAPALTSERQPARTGDNVNHDAHILGALTGIVFVMLTDPAQFRVLLHSF